MRISSEVMPVAMVDPSFATSWGTLGGSPGSARCGPRLVAGSLAPKPVLRRPAPPVVLLAPISGSTVAHGGSGTASTMTALTTSQISLDGIFAARVHVARTPDCTPSVADRYDRFNPGASGREARPPVDSQFRPTISQLAAQRSVDLARSYESAEDRRGLMPEKYCAVTFPSPGWRTRRASADAERPTEWALTPGTAIRAGGR
jgi:hypothetical protein